MNGKELSEQELTNKIEEEPKAINYIARGDFYFQQEDFDNSILDYTFALKFDNCPDDVYLKRGGAYFQNANYKNALTDLNIAVNVLKTSQAYHGRGDTYRMLNEYTKAINDYSNAITLQKDFPSAYYFRAECYYELGDFLKAIDDYSIALETYNDNDDIYNSRAFAYWQIKNKLQEVISDLSKVIELNPQRYKAYTDRAHAYYENKEYEKSIQDYEKFIDLKQTNQGDEYYDSYLSINFAKGRIGVNQLKLKRYDEAISNLEESINNDKCASGYFLFLKYLALCYWHKRRYVKSMISFMRSIFYKLADVILCLRVRFFKH